MAIIITWGTIGGAFLIFLARIADVTLGTLRTINIVRGKKFSASIMGFFEIVVWVLAASQVLSNIHENMLNVLGYALGYSTGNAVGIFIEQKIAMGERVIRIISQKHGIEIVEAIRNTGHGATMFEGQGKDGPVIMIVAVLRRAETDIISDIAENIDQHCIIVSEEVKDINRKLHSYKQPIRWRGLVKK